MKKCQIKSSSTKTERIESREEWGRIGRNREEPGEIGRNREKSG
jgi:hypothetical protein